MIDFFDDLLDAFALKGCGFVFLLFLFLMIYGISDFQFHKSLNFFLIVYLTTGTLRALFHTKYGIIKSENAWFLFGSISIIGGLILLLFGAVQANGLIVGILAFIPGSVLFTYALTQFGSKIIRGNDID